MPRAFQSSTHPLRSPRAPSCSKRGRAVHSKQHPRAPGLVLNVNVMGATQGRRQGSFLCVCVAHERSGHPLVVSTVSTLLSDRIRVDGFAIPMEKLLFVDASTKGEGGCVNPRFGLLFFHLTFCVEDDTLVWPGVNGGGSGSSSTSKGGGGSDVS